MNHHQRTIQSISDDDTDHEDNHSLQQPLTSSSSSSSATQIHSSFTVSNASVATASLRSPSTNIKMIDEKTNGTVEENSISPIETQNNNNNNRRNSSHRHKRERSDSTNSAPDKRFKSNDQITLNVGGKLFETTMQTLTSIPDTWFTACLHGDWQENLSNEIFIDRDAQHFRYILNYLRNERDCRHIFDALPLSTLLELQAEANFYCLSQLVSQLDESIKKKALRVKAKDDLWREHIINEQSNLHFHHHTAASSNLQRTGSTPLTRPNGYAGAHSLWRPIDSSDTSGRPSQNMDDFCTTADF